MTTPLISGIMLDSLRMIADNGGEIHALGGGFWGDSKFNKLDICTCAVYALERRGLLVRMHTDPRYYRDARVITDEGQTAITPTI